MFCLFHSLSIGKYPYLFSKITFDREYPFLVLFQRWIGLGKKIKFKEKKRTKRKEITYTYVYVSFFPRKKERHVYLYIHLLSRRERVSVCYVHRVTLSKRESNSMLLKKENIKRKKNWRRIKIVNLYFFFFIHFLFLCVK